MFIGEYDHSTDEKGRLIVPSKFREELGSKFVVTRGLDGCLFAYGPEEWKKVEEGLKNIPLSNKDGRQFVRFFFAGACEVEQDKQGRILVPQKLREYAGITKEVVSLGVDSKIEIWSKERYEGVETSYEDMDSIMERIAPMGIHI